MSDPTFIVAISADEAERLLPRVEEGWINSTRTRWHSLPTCAGPRPRPMLLTAAFAGGIELCHQCARQPLSVLSLAERVPDRAILPLLVEQTESNYSAGMAHPTGHWTVERRWVLVGEVHVSAIIDARTETGREMAARLLLPDRFDPSLPFVAVLDGATRYAEPRSSLWTRGGRVPLAALPLHVPQEQP